MDQTSDLCWWQFLLFLNEGNGRYFQFEKRRQLLIRVHNETLSAAMLIRSWPRPVGDVSHASFTGTSNRLTLLYSGRAIFAATARAPFA
jgi:hypothetical protein